MRSFGDLASYSYYKNLALVLSVWKSFKGDLPKAMQGVCDTSGEQILMSEIKYIIQASYLFGKDKIQLWLSCLALEQGKKKEFKADCGDPLWPGWTGLWEPGVVMGVTTHCKRFGARWFLRRLQPKPICGSMILSKRRCCQGWCDCNEVETAPHLSAHSGQCKGAWYSFRTSMHIS